MLVGYEMIDSQLGVMCLIGYLSSHIQHMLAEYLLTIIIINTNYYLIYKYSDLILCDLHIQYQKIDKLI